MCVLQQWLKHHITRDTHTHGKGTCYEIHKITQKKTFSQIIVSKVSNKNTEMSSIFGFI